MMGNLTESELATLLGEKTLWRLEASVLIRDWEFEDFAEAMIFVNQIAHLAEQSGHHPDFNIRYNKVRLTLISHDAGGITERDAALAGKIDENF
jgi:4a-hydroxytetrahydrobiopterin dehydratase